MDDVRFNGAVVPWRGEKHVFSDRSGDRIWVEDLTPIETLQFWSYEEDDGERGTAFTVATVALDVEQVRKMRDYLTDFIVRVDAQRERSMTA